jgi:hypothetical protein
MTDLAPIPTAAVELLVRYWTDAKFGVEQSVPIGDHWLHFIVGPVIFLAAALAMRRPVSDFGPWLVLLGLAVVNEVVDVVVGAWTPEQAVNFGDSLSDLIMTMAIPTVVLVVARRFRTSRERG